MRRGWFCPLAYNLTKDDGIAGGKAVANGFTMVTVMAEMSGGSLACEVERQRWEEEQLPRGNKVELISTWRFSGLFEVC